MKQPEIVSILVVDDDDVVAEAIERAMRKQRVANPVIYAADGAEALEILRGSHPEQDIRSPFIVLLDLNMPRMNGLEFLDELRGDPELSGTVVFVLTSSDLESDMLAAYRAHVAGYMVKSEVGKDFRKAIELLEQYWITISLPAA